MGKKLTEEQLQWLRDNGARLSRKEMTRQFNKLFNDNRTEGTLKTTCTRMGIIRDKAVVKESQRRRAHKPIGSELLHQGFTFVKVRNEPNGSLNNYELKQRYVWKQRHGAIPGNHMIIFLNHDRTDFSQDNLYCISKAWNALMIRNNWYTDSREHTLTAIKWCELYFARKNLEGL
jgi:hypothetical protein